MLFLAPEQFSSTRKMDTLYDWQDLVDGRKYRWGRNPKRKNKKHCLCIGEIEVNTTETLIWPEHPTTEQSNQLNAKIRKILKRAKGEFNV